MGHVDGISVLKRAKALDPKTRVIIATGSTDVNYAIEALRLNANDYILKPFDLNHFVRKVLDCFNQSENKPKTKKSVA
jgi:DNA-binding NtrC family response regulator